MLYNTYECLHVEVVLAASVLDEALVYLSVTLLYVREPDFTNTVTAVCSSVKVLAQLSISAVLRCFSQSLVYHHYMETSC